jgi:hypothetical protein
MPMVGITAGGVDAVQRPGAEPAALVVVGAERAMVNGGRQLGQWRRWPRPGDSDRLGGLAAESAEVRRRALVSVIAGSDLLILKRLPNYYFLFTEFFCQFAV